MKRKRPIHQYVIQHQSEQEDVSMTFFESDTSCEHGSLVVGTYHAKERTFNLECNHWGDFDLTTDGEMEKIYMFDTKNTAKLMKLMRQKQPFLFLEALRDSLVRPNDRDCAKSIIEYCKAHNVDYDYWAIY